MSRMHIEILPWQVIASDFGLKGDVFIFAGVGAVLEMISGLDPLSVMNPDT